MKVRIVLLATIATLSAIGLVWKAEVLHGRTAKPIATRPGVESFDARIRANADQMLQAGQRTFRFDTFGDEAYWSDGLGLDRAIAGEKNGGTGAGVSPRAALALGLKVDMDALPAALVAQIILFLILRKQSPEPVPHLKTS